MTPDPDDQDAFTWEGDEHPSRAPLHRPSAPDKPAAAVHTTAAPESSSPTSAGADAAADPSAATPDSGSTEAVEREPMGNIALVASGLLGGIYLLYVVGWIIGGLRVSRVAGYLVSLNGTPPATWESGNVVGVWLAALAPVLWFATVWITTRRARPWVRWVWLIAGAVLLVPWPLFTIGAHG